MARRSSQTDIPLAKAGLRDANMTSMTTGSRPCTRPRYVLAYASVACFLLVLLLLHAQTVSNIATMPPSSSWKTTLVSLLGLSGSSAVIAAPPSDQPASSLGPTSNGTASSTTGAPGAQFTPSAAIDDSASLLPTIKDPAAVDAQRVCPGYKASNVRKTAYGFNASLTLDGEPCYAYGTDIEQLVLTVDYQTAHRLSIKIQPAHISAENQSWFLIPDDFVPEGVHGKPSDDSASTDLRLTWTNDPTFSFNVLRQSTGDVLFSTAGSKLIYEDQFIEFVTSLSKDYNLYGMGEHFHSLRLGNNYTATLFAADNGNPIDANLYGSHPFYLDTRYYEQDPETGERKLLTGDANGDADYVSSSHGLFYRNAHALEARLSATNLTWQALGGTVDLYFFDGPTQPDVTTQYLDVIGFPTMQQYWTLGFHQCRWGYENWSTLEQVVTNFKNADIPLETIWSDIDYMNQYRDFENDQNTFPYDEGKIFLDKLHARGQHYIPIVDSAIYIPNPHNASDAYHTYARGHELDVFMKNPDGSEYIGEVWPGYTVFPDWLAANATQWWTEQMQSHYSKVNWDGIWIDMSEVASFCIGPCGSGNLSLNPVHTPFSLPGEPGSLQVEYPEAFDVTNATEAAAASALSSAQAAAATAASVPVKIENTHARTNVTPGVRQLTYPPYVINNVLGELSTHAVAPNATHSGGVKEYDVHNLFGHSILRATYEALRAISPTRRPFIIGRSTFAGSGRYAGHWGGDNNSKFWSMAFSIPQALSMSLFGISMFGADVCGFSENSDAELCSRWMQLGAFTTFYRNHNVLSAIDQEPYVWSQVAEASRRVMRVRYQLLPYMYTLMYRASTEGSTVLRALSWEFPNDPGLRNVDTQFLLGPAILVTPVLAPNARTVRGVFPDSGRGGRWYDWYDGAEILARRGENVTLRADIEHINVHVRGGHVLPLQAAALTTAEARASSWELLVALDGRGEARGELYLDDGVSVVQDRTLSVDFAVGKGTLRASARGDWVERPALRQVTVLGLTGKPDKVSLEGKDVDFEFRDGKLSVTGLEGETRDGAWARDWVLTWA